MVYSELNEAKIFKFFKGSLKVFNKSKLQELERSIKYLQEALNREIENRYESEFKYDSQIKTIMNYLKVEFKTIPNHVEVVHKFSKDED